MDLEQFAPCKHSGAAPADVVERVADLIVLLGGKKDFLASQGISPEEYESALHGAIEKLRGSRSASNADRRHFLVTLLKEMVTRGLIDDLQSPIYGKDTVYRLRVLGQRDIAIIQKGCPDGRHSSVAWSRPEWASEVYLWWCCSSMSNEPGVHVWKGVNRLRNRFLSDAPDAIDGVIFHNELCGTPSRPCPKSALAIEIAGQRVPPPCVFVMPSRDEDSTEWNWDGSRQLKFPSLLFQLFGIHPERSSGYTGHVGFRRRGTLVRTNVTWNYGPGRSNSHRS